MSTQALVVEGSESRGRAVMSRSASRVAAMGLALVLAVLLAGDRGRAGAVPAAIYGQDPLEVLELKVRPNIIVVLDSSGSMTNIATEGVNTNSGDHPRSKMFQAKQVLRQVFQDNQDKVSFQLGTYTQTGVTFRNQNATTVGNRFQYVASAMSSTELNVRGARGDTLGRGIQSWQIILPAWNRLYFGEQGGVVCYATVPGTPRFYNRGSDLATDLTAAMNAATCTSGSRANTYTVTYATNTGIFTISRQSGSRTFNIRWADSPSSIRGALGRRTQGNTSLSTNNVTSAAPYRLLYRQTGTATSGAELNTRWSFTELIGGTNRTFYQAAAGRLWNGEVIRVQADGVVCGMTFPTAAERTSPPSFRLQLVANNCGADTAGQTATFAFGGGDFGGNSQSCRGFRSKSDLIPCDLQSPPAPTQFQLVDPYIDLELPFDATGVPRDMTTNGAAYGTATYGVPDGVPDYLEVQDGSWQTQSIDVAPSAKADGATPIANSLIDIKGLAAGTNDCLSNPPPPTGKLDSVAVAGTTGACVSRGFSKLWTTGQAGATTMAGPAPWQITPIRDHGVCPGGAATCASALRKPKEKTIVLFVTDGDDTCYTRTGTSNGDANALRAAYYAERLYARIDAADPASSVQTYVIGYGGAFTGGEPYRLNWIAWGGSGLGQGLPGQPAIADDGTQWTDSATNITNARALCSTCTDAFVAPDGATLATQLQALINQGAQDGDFTAQQSITETVFEYADTVAAPNTKDARWPTPQDSIDPEVAGRYSVLVPTLMVSSFSLPGFKGQVKAYQNVGGNTVLRWSAGDKLQNLVATGMNACDFPPAGGTYPAGECGFINLHANATDASISTSPATIKRRVYSTSRNGVFDFSPATLIAGTANGRTRLWPPEPAMIPADYTSLGTLDVELGLPTDTPTCTLRSPFTSCVDQELADLQSQFKACLGGNLPAECTSATPLTKLRAARREAREIIYAFMAGATPVPEGTGWKRASADVSVLGVTVPRYALVYKARDWPLADSEFATAAIMAPPLRVEPNGTPFVNEYRLYRGGPRDANQKNTSSSTATQVFKGFGLRNPDSDNTVANDTVDTRLGLKPAMTVAFVPMNDGLHAFRMGPSRWDGSAPCLLAPNLTTVNSQYDCGGEELWNFVPYDQVRTLRLLAQYQPQTRENHVYMLARGVRFADVFVPNQAPGGAVSTMSGVTIDGIGPLQDPRLASMKGVWRRLIYFGRGIGGKHLTALDITGIGPYTARASQTGGPIPLWSRGNPDTQNGLPGGLPNGFGGDALSDQADYATMGQTWSMPTVAYVDNTIASYSTARRPNPDGPDFVLFVGSGYGSTPSEGTTLYTLDALSGDVIGAANVETVASTYGLTRGASVPYPNAIVANPVGFNYTNFVIGKTVHPAQNKVTRVYVGDIHGRLWKMLSAQPNTVIPVADLGADQPIGTAASLLALPHTENPSEPPPAGQVPYIFVASGADLRAEGPFRVFAFRDEGSPVDTATTGTVDAGDGTTAYPPSVHVFHRTYDEGDPLANCGPLPAAVFRGTIQPSVTFDASFDANGQISSAPLGRVFFGGTRLSLPNTKYAPPTPLACATGLYPCRSQFDSILYLLSAKSGLAAYDMNASGDDAYRIFRDNRIAAIGMQADPDPASGGSRFNPDAGQIRGTPPPPPPPGVPPGQQNATANVVMVREPGRPAPAIRYGTTVCQ